MNSPNDVTTAGPHTPEQRTVWLDPDPLSREWPRPRRLSGLTRTLVIGIPVLALVLLIGVVWLFGGFKPKDGDFIDLPPGQVIENGPVQLTFDSAVAYQRLDFDDQPEAWVVEVQGTARAVDNESVDLTSLLACAAPERGSANAEIDVELPHLLGGDADVQPGMPAVPFVMRCEFPTDWQAGSQILAGSPRQAYRSLDPLGLSDDLGWTDRGGFYRVLLPYEILPPQFR